MLQRDRGRGTSEAQNRRLADLEIPAGAWELTATSGEWVLSREFHQRFRGVVAGDGQTIEGRWEASPDGRTWAEDFVVTYRRAG